MSIKTFIGGVHPYEGKELSKNAPVKSVFPKGELAIPVSQHIGAPSKPIVEVGQHVLKGEKIAQADGFISANIHSPVSGDVTAIEDRMLVGGANGECIIIQPDGKNELFLYNDIEINLTKEYIRKMVEECGVVGMGGACFPTHVKLTPKDDELIEYVIVNAAECEPYITADYRRLVEQPDEVIEGLTIMLKLFPNAEGIIAVETNKPDVIENLTKKTMGIDRVSVVPVKTKYPQGSERHIIYACTKRKINSSMLPADAGVIVDNVDTVYNIYQAVKNRKPLTERIMTVSGDGVEKPGNFAVPFGISYKEVIEEAGGYSEDVEKMIAGGPLMGVALYDLDVPVTKGSSALLAFSYDDMAHCTQTNCINCGFCAKVCPERLLCANVAKAADANDMELFVKMHGMECIECGACNYNCPAKRNLTQSIRRMKQQVIADRKGKSE